MKKKAKTFEEYITNPIEAKDKKYQFFFDALWSYDSRVDGHESAEDHWHSYWMEIIEELRKLK